MADLFSDYFNKIIIERNLTKDGDQAFMSKALDTPLKDALEDGQRSWRLSKIFSQRQNRASGIYLFGSVGRGKTFLMDLIYEWLPSKKKARFHFHDFMTVLHEKLQKISSAEEGAPLDVFISEFSKDTSYLFLDEFMVDNISDAMILNRLFKGLYEKSVFFMTTSNSPPDRLYEKGFHRDRFLPFIAFLEKTAFIQSLGGEKDYRRTIGLRKYALTKSSREDQKFLEKMWEQFTGRVACLEIKNMAITGRGWHVVAEHKESVWVTFNEVCKKNRWSRDYKIFLEKYDTIFLEGVPRFFEDQKDEAKRFTTFIDLLYDKGKGLYATGREAPKNLYHLRAGKEGFLRTISRLEELLQ